MPRDFHPIHQSLRCQQPQNEIKKITGMVIAAYLLSHLSLWKEHSRSLKYHWTSLQSVIHLLEKLFAIGKELPHFTARYRRNLKDAHRIYGFLYCHLITTFPQSICWARPTKFFPIKYATNLEVRRWKRWGHQRRRRISYHYQLWRNDFTPWLKAQSSQSLPYHAAVGESQQDRQFLKNAKGKLQG